MHLENPVRESAWDGFGASTARFLCKKKEKEFEASFVIKYSQLSA